MKKSNKIKALGVVFFIVIVLSLLNVAFTFEYKKTKKDIKNYKINGDIKAKESYDILIHTIGYKQTEIIIGYEVSNNIDIYLLSSTDHSLFVNESSFGYILYYRDVVRGYENLGIHNGGCIYYIILNNLNRDYSVSFMVNIVVKKS